MAEAEFRHGARQCFYEIRLLRAEGRILSLQEGAPCSYFDPERNADVLYFHPPFLFYSIREVAEAAGIPLHPGRAELGAAGTERNDQNGNWNCQNVLAFFDRRCPANPLSASCCTD